MAAGGTPSLSQFLWNASSGLLEQVRRSKFVEGVAKGDLDPDFYGNYCLQNGAYCCEIAKLWSELSENPDVDNTLREHAEVAKRKFQASSTDVFNGWNVRDEDEYGFGVIQKRPIEDYISFTSKVMSNSWPDMLIATYACLKLWEYLTDDYLPPIHAQTSNIYNIWVDKNNSGGSLLRAQATLIDKYEEKWYNNRDEACKIFHTAMKHEINFFNKAGHET